MNSPLNGVRQSAAYKNWTGGPPTAPAAATSAPAASAADLPEGTVAVDAVHLAALRAAARSGRTARARQLVAAAVEDGRVPPSRRAFWVGRLTADAGAERALASLVAAGLPPVALSSGTDVRASAAYKNWTGGPRSAG